VFPGKAREKRKWMEKVLAFRRRLFFKGIVVIDPLNGSTSERDTLG